MRQVEFHPEAIEEASAAYSWYLEQSPAAGTAFLADLDRAIDDIGESPERFPIHEGDIRRCLLRRFPYYLAFRTEAEHSLVLAVAHGRRRPGYWKGR